MDQWSSKKTYNFKAKGIFMACKQSSSPYYSGEFGAETIYSFECFCQAGEHTVSFKKIGYPCHSIMDNLHKHSEDAQKTLCKFNTLQELMERYFELNPVEIFGMRTYSICKSGPNDIVEYICDFEDIIPIYISYLQIDNKKLRKSVIMLKRQNEELNLALYYHPGGDAAQQAKEDFESMINKD